MQHVSWLRLVVTLALIATLSAACAGAASGTPPAPLLAHQ
jgi:hypothetical protein